MIDGEARRKEILHTLANEEKPVSASKFASRFQVSRQIIVGDIALLKSIRRGYYCNGKRLRS